ncbi:glucose repression mediator protein [Malassezia pachydermatis]
MVSRDLGAPARAPLYTSPPNTSSHTPSSAAGGRLPAAMELVPVPVAQGNVPVMYMDVRQTPPSVSNEAMQRSPRMMLGSDPTSAAMPPPGVDRVVASLNKLSAGNEQTWLSIGSAAEAMNDPTRALAAYDSALLHNPYSVPALSAMASVYRSMDHFDLAVEYFQRVLDIDRENGEVWGAMGHCYLMMDELEKAYSAYHQALCFLPNPKEPKLWYGIGILYDRYGSLEHAEETFSSVVRMNPDYEKANEIYFRLGIIYKQLGQYSSSLDCFRHILNNPPKPLTEMDIWFQIGHVYEQQQEFNLAKEAYERVLSENTNHAKVLQQLGGLYMQPSSGFYDHDKAMELLRHSLESDSNDPQTWYLMGRCYMNAQEYSKAYDAYQQAVYVDGKNPALWCSIGILYFQISQFHDALGAFSRSIRLNPYIPEIWFNLGALYESCNNQISDAIDAYRRTLELDPENSLVQKRLPLLQKAEPLGKAVPNIPAPKDVPIAAYASAVLNPAGSPSAPGVEGEEPSWSGEPPAVHPRDAVMEDERTVARAHSPSHRMYNDGPAGPVSLPSYASTHNEQSRDTPSMAKPYTAPSEWDRQSASSYADDRMGAYPSRGPPPSRYAYEGRSGRYESYRDTHPYAGPSSHPSMARRGPTSPIRDMERQDHESDPMLRRKRDIPNLRSTASLRSTSSDVRTMTGYSSEREAEGPPPRSAMPVSSSREIDEDYDEGAASALMGLAGAAASAYEANAWNRQHGENKMSPGRPKRSGEPNRPFTDVKRRRNDDQD